MRDFIPLLIVCYVAPWLVVVAVLGFIILVFS